VGYTAVSNRLDTGALLLFLILVCWQMPHFYAIAIFRLKDYAAAKIPTLPIRRGILQTKRHVLLFVIAFTMVSVLLTVFGYTGYTYAIVMVGLGIWWLRLATLGFHTDNDERWARSVFRASLIILLAFSTLISVNSLVP